MSDEKRAWTAEEILDALWYSAESASHEQSALAAYLARCTRLMAAFEKVYPLVDVVARDSSHEADLAVANHFDQLRAAIDEEGDK